MSSTTFTVKKAKRPRLHLSFGGAPKPAARTRPVVPVPSHTNKRKVDDALRAIAVGGVTYSLRAGFLAQCIVTERQLSLEARVFGTSRVHRRRG